MNPTTARRPVCVVGEFDGLHLGHQRLLDAGRAFALRARVGCVAVVLRQSSGDPEIQSVGDRCAALVTRGATIAVALAPPSSVGTHGATGVVDQIVGSFDPRVVMMACLPTPTSSLEFPRLREGFATRGVDVIEVPRIYDETGVPITTSVVRAAVEAGDVAKVSGLLGRPFAVTGTVQVGDRRGRTIGFPTANLDPSELGLVPGLGVYRGWVAWRGGRWSAAINLGRRPTFHNGQSPLLEAHLLDFDGDLYGARVTVSFEERLRDERRFDSVEDLCRQLRMDVEQVRRPSLRSPGSA